ncbi:exonuclease domain-containing protein, partial [Clostridium botulinum]
MNASLVQVLKTELDSKNVHTDNIQILKVQYLTKSNRLKIVLKSVNEINDDIKRLIKSIISKKLMGFNNIDLVCYKDVSNISLDEISKQYWIDIVENVSKVMPVSKQSLITSSRSIEGNLLVLRIGDKFMCKLFETKRLGNIIQSVITDMFALKSIVNIKYDPELKDSNYIEVKVKEEKQIIQNALKESKSGNSSVNSEKNDNKENNKSSDKSNYYNKRKHTAKNPNAIFGRDVSGEITNIIDVNETSGVVNICGDIFKVNIIETKSGRKIITFFITDYTSSITVKCFPKPKETEQLLEDIQEGLHCKVRGEAVHDSFAREVVIMGRDIVKTSKLEKMDTFEEKRVELHLHTQMSAMDGMSSAKSLIERAAKWGHPAVAITDHGVVQAYPDAMDAAKKYNIKIIYGVEAYLVNDGVPIVTNVREQTINDTFVVFDLETTGFSSAYDKIIEIGAVKIKNGNIIDSFSTFVNPEIKVPYNITELTSITNDDVKNADTIDSILPKFIEFCGDSVLVAHNANFDMSFIRKNCNDLNIDINYTVMDTVPLAKFLFPELKRYKLNTIAKHLGVSLENHHRAVDDAKATGDILLCCFKLLDDMKITSLDSLNKEFLGNIDVKKLPTYHLIILAKNQVGLKNLYKLISYSNLDYFFRKPRMPKSLIEQYKEGLIIGSACEAGEVYKAVLEGKSQEELKQMIKFYNYLEIQPIMNNEFMLKKGIVKSEEQLKEV